MIIYQYKLKCSKVQKALLDEAIRTCQFLRNVALRYWMDHRNEKFNKYTLQELACDRNLKENHEFALKLNSQARQQAVLRAANAILRFFKKQGKFPKFKKDVRSFTLTQSGWKLNNECNHLTLTDKLGIGKMKLVGKGNLHFYTREQIKQITIIKRADGYYALFCVDIERKEDVGYTGKEIGIDLGLEYMYTDSNGVHKENPRFFKKSEVALKRLQRGVSRKKKGSSNRKKAKIKYQRKHLKVQRQREDFVVKTARQLYLSNDTVFLEDLSVAKMIQRNKFKSIRKSISTVCWGKFKEWLKRYSEIFNKNLILVNPRNTSQLCSCCGSMVAKDLSVRVHKCPNCGFEAHRDHNASLNILKIGQGMPESATLKGCEKPKERKSSNLKLVSSNQVCSVI